MFESSRPSGPAWSCAITALAGIGYCLLNALGQADAICVTAGCSLFSEATVAGISLWWIGLIAFSITLFVALPGWRTLGAVLSGIMLTADLGFLAVMAFTTPCVPCIGVACLFALQFFCFTSSTGKRGAGATSLLILWAIFLSPNLVASVNEVMGTWAIYGTDSADMKVFFSPSCPTCKKTVEALSRDTEANIAYYPISEESADEDRIIVMQRALADGASLYVAFKRGVRNDSPVDITPIERLSLKWQLFRNRVRLISMGADRIPVLVTNGVPRSFIEPHAKNNAPAISTPSVPQNNSIDDGLNFGDFAGCSEGTAQDPAVPCD